MFPGFEDQKLKKNVQLKKKLMIKNCHLLIPMPL
jgi:hypothetical protein